MRESLDIAAKFAVVQVDFHAYLSQRVGRAVVLDHGLVLIAHSLLALGEVLEAR